MIWSNTVATSSSSKVGDFGQWKKKLQQHSGLHRPTDELPFSPCIEIAWRLVKTAGGNGFATEAAGAALSFAFAQLAVPEIISFTTLDNAASERVMQRLGMRRDAQRSSIPLVLQGTLCASTSYIVPTQAHEP